MGYARLSRECYGDLSGQCLPIFRLGGFQFSCFAEDLGEAVCEAIEGCALLAVLQGATDDLHVMLSGKQGVDEAIEAGPQSRGRLRLWSQMPGFGASQLKLALEIGKGHIHIAQ